VKTLAGEEFALADLRGRVVLLNVWATWCGPCVREMPKLQELHIEYEAEGLAVLGASVDRGAAEGEVRRFIEANGISFEILLDPDAQVETRFRTLGVPESFLIDREGILRARWIGEFDPGSEAVRSEIADLLAESRS
jgi:cytochrome c-type biogenesis protein